MNIVKSDYYKEITSFLNDKNGVTVSDTGAITVISPDIALHFSKISKNHYQTVVIYKGATFTYNDGSLLAAMARIKELCDSYAV